MSDHPIVKYNNQIKLIDINKYFDKNISLILYIEELRKIKTKNDMNMAFLVCSDETNKEDFIVFPNKFNLLNDLKVGDIVKVYGKVERRYDKYQVLVNDIRKVYE